ncbi:hypothetical protein [Pseudomonas brassicacearum]|uniref:hypothetical protein n=1 Tax=Pseudomonas brassicacearum TaxID=930166 RepID=UPI0011CDF7DF|nr:hypothetical protein [Pseudomonas brassicacearum]
MSIPRYRAFMERVEMFGYLAGKAKALSESVGDKALSAKDSILDSVGEGKNVAADQMNKYWPQIERVLVDGLLTVAHDRIKDDEVFLLVAEKAFELLPAPVRLILPRSVFLAQTEKRRASIVGMIESKREQRLALESPASVEDATKAVGS